MDFFGRCVFGGLVVGQDRVLVPTPPGNPAKAGWGQAPNPNGSLINKHIDLNGHHRLAVQKNLLAAISGWICSAEATSGDFRAIGAVLG